MGAELQNLIKEISELRDGDTSNDSIDWNIILNHSLNSELEKTLSCADISVLNALIDELYFLEIEIEVKKLVKMCMKSLLNIIMVNIGRMIGIRKNEIGIINKYNLYS